jgi:hypothetical protein
MARAGPTWVLLDAHGGKGRRCAPRKTESKLLYLAPGGGRIDGTAPRLRPPSLTLPLRSHIITSPSQASPLEHHGQALA